MTWFEPWQPANSKTPPSLERNVRFPVSVIFARLLQKDEIADPQGSPWLQERGSEVAVSVRDTPKHRGERALEQTYLGSGRRWRLGAEGPMEPIVSILQNITENCLKRGHPEIVKGEDSTDLQALVGENEVKDGKIEEVGSVDEAKLKRRQRRDNDLRKGFVKIEKIGKTGEANVFKAASLRIRGLKRVANMMNSTSCVLERLQNGQSGSTRAETDLEGVLRLQFADYLIQLECFAQIHMIEEARANVARLMVSQKIVLRNRTHLFDKSWRTLENTSERRRQLSG